MIQTINDIISPAIETNIDFSYQKHEQNGNWYFIKQNRDFRENDGIQFIFVSAQKPIAFHINDCKILNWNRIVYVYEISINDPKYVEKILT